MLFWAVLFGYLQAYTNPPLLATILLLLPFLALAWTLSLISRGNGLGDGRLGHPKDFWAQDDRQHSLEGGRRFVRQGRTANHQCINASCRKRRLAEDENRCGSRTRSTGAPHSLSIRLRLSSRPSRRRQKPIWLA